MEKYFHGNRVFLGKYTSATPVTGYHFDPTPEPDEYKRRESKLKKLFKAVCQMQNTQGAARGHADRDARYLFPSVDGDEMTSRWDMQEYPPDILITNTSMLNAMLVVMLAGIYTAAFLGRPGPRFAVGAFPPPPGCDSRNAVMSASLYRTVRPLIFL
jgi:hypothetical protein